MLFTYLFVIDFGLLALTLIESRLMAVQAVAGLATFIFLGGWTGNYLTIDHLYTALAFYFVFTLFHTAAPSALQRLRKIDMPGWSHAFPAFGLVLVLIPMFQLTEVPLLIWPFVFIVDLVGIALALTTATLLPAIALLLLTLVAIGAMALANPERADRFTNRALYSGRVCTVLFRRDELGRAARQTNREV